jgi:class 3 adenylate cyclase
MRDAFLHLAPYFLKYYPGGADALRLVVDESFHDLLVGIEPDEPGIVVRSGPSHGWRVSDLAYELFVTTFKVVDEGGRYAGMVTILKPSAGMSSLMSIAATLDTSYLQRLETLAFPSRRRSAVLMADMVGSARLSRRLSTEAFYELSAALLRVGDECIMSAGGIVGRHAGDGMVGFFPAENDAATSDAARRCIEASRSLRLATSGAVADVLRRKRKDSAVIFRHGLHWADRAYIGRIFTRGRIEVTALGQEVAEAARIESCAREGATLASKDLLEQLTHEDAALVGLDLRGLRYRELGSLKTARQKAIRDASEILVCTLDKPRRRKSR